MAAPRRIPILVAPAASNDELRQSISQGLNSLQQQILSYLPITDYGGKRISNVGSPQQMADVVTLGYLRTTLAQISTVATRGAGSVSSVIGPVISTGFFPVTPSGGNATIDLANGGVQQITLNGSAVTILDPVFTTGSLVAGVEFILLLKQDGTGGRAAPTFTSGAGGFVSNTASQVQLVGTANTRTSLTFMYDGVYWFLCQVPMTGMTIS